MKRADADLRRELSELHRLTFAGRIEQLTHALHEGQLRIDNAVARLATQTGAKARLLGRLRHTEE